MGRIMNNLNPQRLRNKMRKTLKCINILYLLFKIKYLVVLLKEINNFNNNQINKGIMLS